MGKPAATPEICENEEKNARRRQRVEKKLQELEETQEEETKEKEVNGEVYSDLIEYADQYFNNIERDGNIMATLTRKKVDMIPKYEMVTFSKSSSISNSHVHLYDPENVQVACLMWRVRELTKPYY
jgi:hypothetical protein